MLLTALFDLDADPNESRNLLLAPTAEVTRVVGQIKAKLAAAFGSWREIAADLARQEYALAGAIKRMLNRQLSRGWGAWVEMATERAAFTQKLRKGLSYMLNRNLAMGFATWRQAVAPRQHQRYDQQAILDPLGMSQRLQNDQPLVLSRAVAGISHRLIHEIAIR